MCAEAGSLTKRLADMSSLLFPKASNKSLSCDLSGLESVDITTPLFSAEFARCNFLLDINDAPFCSIR